MTPTFFPSQADFRKWLDANHNKETELLVGFYKVDSGKPSMTWSESVDQSLCFGWIDGVRKSIDGASYSIRFTPRKVKSIWSTINIKKVEELTKQGLMQAAGLAIFEKREESRSNIYAYEKAPAVFDAALEELFKSHSKAWNFFHSQAPSYRKVVIYWVMSAKQEATKLSRFEKLLAASEVGKRL